MIRAIVAYGDPVLKKEAEEVQENHPDLGQLIEDMGAMHEADGVGLAPKMDCRCACRGRRLAFGGRRRGPGCVGFKRVMINPVLFDFQRKRRPWKRAVCRFRRP